MSAREFGINPHVRFLLCLLLLSGLVGCGGGLGTLHPVEGKAEFTDGKALPDGWKLQFHPEGWKPAVQVDIVGKVDSTGKYVMETNGKKGVPKGKYKVTVNTQVPMAAGGDILGKPDPGKLASQQKKPINPKYENQNESDKIVSVPEGPFDLKFDR